MTELVSHIMEFVAAKRDMTDLYPRLLALSRLSLIPRFFPGKHVVSSPDPHPLTRRNGLVNQVEFLGLAGALATV